MPSLRHTLYLLSSVLLGLLRPQGLALLDVALALEEGYELQLSLLLLHPLRHLYRGHTAIALRVASTHALQQGSPSIWFPRQARQVVAFRCEREGR